MTPLERYEQAHAHADFYPDRDQARAIARLDTLYHQLVATPAREARGRRWLRTLLGRRPPYLKGLYLFGGVGRGKTFVLDTFYACVPAPLGHRIHFHSFMRDVHAELKRLRGARDPLRIVAEHWARELRVLCLDEFHVVDITDAMMLSQLLSALFARGVTLVTTSNEAPDELYRGGLQRERFLPAIDLLERHLEIFEFRGSIDYRWRTLTQAATYYAPSDEMAETALRHQFEALTHTAVEPRAPLEIEGRAIAVKAQEDGVVWFDFDALCEGPRGMGDYIEIACCFHTVLISRVPKFSEDNNDAARRFVNLVDELYDRGVNLLVSAADIPAALYSGSRLALAFRRTASRLVEMQTEEYLAKPHLPEGSKLYKSKD